jgi:hypothetical protein
VQQQGQSEKVLREEEVKLYVTIVRDERSEIRGQFDVNQQIERQKVEDITTPTQQAIE